MSYLRRPLPAPLSSRSFSRWPSAPRRASRGSSSTHRRNDGGAADMATTGGRGHRLRSRSPTRERRCPRWRSSKAGPARPSVTCTPPNGRYCGVIGNGCFGTIDCGANCAADEVCDNGRLRGRVQLRGAGLHGRDRTVLRHRGQRLRPGHGLRRSATRAWSARRACASPGPAACRSPARPPPASYCGTIGDGCGGTLPCGDCPAGSTCGGAGVANTCAPTNCTPGTCNGGRRRQATAGRSVTAAGDRSIAAAAPGRRSAPRTSVGCRAACR